MMISLNTVNYGLHSCYVTGKCYFPLLCNLGVCSIRINEKINLSLFLFVSYLRDVSVSSRLHWRDEGEMFMLIKTMMVLAFALKESCITWLRWHATVIIHPMIKHEKSLLFMATMNTAFNVSLPVSSCYSCMVHGAVQQTRLRSHHRPRAIKDLLMELASCREKKRRIKKSICYYLTILEVTI